MSGPPLNLDIYETRLDGGVRLSVAGELDMATSPILEERLAPLREARSRVRLDLSKLGFIDSTGLHLLVRLLAAARKEHWQLEVEPNVTPNVRELLRLTRLERIVLDGENPAE